MERSENAEKYAPFWANAFPEEKLLEGKSLLDRTGMRGTGKRRYQWGVGVTKRQLSE